MNMEKFMPEGWLADTVENKSAIISPDTLTNACELGRTLEARALICDSGHNLIVDLGAMRGIIPRDEGAMGLSDGSVRDIAVISKVNKPVCFKVMEIVRQPDGKQIALLSRRKAQEECVKKYILSLSPGDIIDARVTHLEPFGAFVDIGCGIVSLIPIDLISVSRISHPHDRFYIGQDIRVIVKYVDAFSGRVCLSHKELLGTWEENAALFGSGETVAGIIRSVESYGIFIELTPNLAGLAEPKEGVRPGQQASVYIKNLIPEKMKVKLIIVDSFEADYMTTKLNYFINDNHIDKWVYSPPSCPKALETVFNGECEEYEKNVELGRV